MTDRKPVDFVIVTALEEERDAVLDRLPGWQKLPPSEQDIRVYYQAELPVTYPGGAESAYSIVVVSLLEMGRVEAANATGDAIRRWWPRYVLLVGIAGGVGKRGVKLGDILVSDQVVDYEQQKITPDGPQIRWEAHRADPRLLGAAKSLATQDCLALVKEKRPTGGGPTRHVGPIATGDKVIADEELLKRHEEVWRKLTGVEMEAGGAASACFQSAERPGFFMIRAVSDLADKRKGSPRVQKWRSYACDVAASYAVTLLRQGPVPSGDAGVVPAIRTPGAPTPFMAPSKPKNYVERTATLEKLCEKLLEGRDQAVVLYGDGGFGKTTLASSICHDDRIRVMFPDGILWLTLGQQPDLKGWLENLCEVLSGKHQPFNDSDKASDFFSRQISGRRCLLVLDDVWRRSHLQPFLRGGESCFRLITTRRARVAWDFSVIEVEEMTEEESQALLAWRLEYEPTDQELLVDLAKRIRAWRWPLPLEHVNAALRYQSFSLGDLRAAIAYLNQTIDRQGEMALFKEASYESLERSIELSLAYLDEEELSRLLELSIFPEDMAFQLGQASILWGKNDFEVVELLRKMSDLALLKFDLNEVRIHDLSRWYYRKRLESTSTPEQIRQMIARIMPVSAWAAEKFSDFHLIFEDAFKICERIPALRPNTGVCFVLAKLLEEFVDVGHDPVAGKYLQDTAPQEAGPCEFRGVAEMGKTGHEILLIDTGLDVRKVGKPVQTVMESVPGYSSKLGHNLVLLRNPSHRSAVFFLQYFKGVGEGVCEEERYGAGAVVLGFFVLLLAQESLLFDAFDFTIPGSTTNVFQVFFGERGVFPDPLPLILIGDGRFLLSIRPLADVPQSLLSMHEVVDLNLDLVDYYESLSPAETDSLESRLVQLNNAAIGYAYRDELGTARSLLTVALTMADESAQSASFQSRIKQNLRLVKTGGWTNIIQQERWEPDRFHPFRPRLPYQFEPRWGWSEWDD